MTLHHRNLCSTIAPILRDHFRSDACLAGEACDGQAHADDVLVELSAAKSAALP